MEVATSDAIPSWLPWLVEHGGLPGVLAAAGWWLRGLLSGGIPLVVSLSEQDRTEIRRLRRALTGSEDG